TATWESQAVWSIFDKELKTEFGGVKILWIWVHPPGQFHMTRKAVHTPEDLIGLKIRSATPTTVSMVKALGATPVSIPAPEAYNALERGDVCDRVYPWEP